MYMKRNMFVLQDVIGKCCKVSAKKWTGGDKKLL